MNQVQESSPVLIFSEDSRSIQADFKDIDKEEPGRAEKQYCNHTYRAFCQQLRRPAGDLEGSVLYGIGRRRELQTACGVQNFAGNFALLLGNESVSVML